MKVYETKSIRNLAFLGHAGSGKTSFLESMLFVSGAINRRGTIEDGNTVSDYNDIEHEKGSSVFATPCAIEWKDVKINVIDGPGYDDYVGEAFAALHVADVGVIFINAQNGPEVGSELAYSYAQKADKPLLFVINKMDLDQANFDKVYEDVKAAFHGAKLLQFPIGKGAASNSIVDILSQKLLVYGADGKYEVKDLPADVKDQMEEYRNELIESVAETDEELMTKYFEAGELSDDELAGGLKNAIKSRQIYPIFVGSGKNVVGAINLLDFAVNVLPSPAELPLPLAEGSKDVTCNSNQPASLFVYKIYSDARLGDMTFFKVMTGKLVQSADMLNEQRSSSERIGQIFSMAGKKREELPQMLAGDLGATVKLKNTHINNTLHEKGFNVIYKGVEYPNSKIRAAIVPKTKGEEEKVGMGLHSLHIEDPTIVVEHSQELRQTIVHAQGELHLALAKWRLLNRYKVEAEFTEPRVPYRETIQKAINSSYRHKKQSGGSGQFAEVHMRVEPWYENMPNPDGLTVRGKDLQDLPWGGKLEYVNCIVGGVIDQRFMPAILKGVMEKMQVGPLTGSYVRDIRVSIYDGKMHPVDSNEAAFKTAGMMAFKDAFVQAAPKILEPIYNVEIKAPEEFIGDVMSDLPSRRGVILGIETEGRYQKIKARMPLAELDKYSTGLRSMTQARATYTSEFAEYQVAPPNVQQELMDAYKKSQAEEE
ncbi:MAG: elongation factor G [Chloroflexota bacterium]